ncbi:DUF4328 domain-containing protein [Allostreptomyces psammosilenae]|uniref:DUF4328 domain-containing protein n=1 Tax=Allostreptomyces psammosilenae TaxID=1892865 RepID=A0A852ZS26_9ACTN|nr:DUF4328 domain-containing protein [Allostreptomyces psammosilenae]NYI05236.1 hypothetical protein [Allostreptomyces psammosilenae]
MLCPRCATTTLTASGQCPRCDGVAAPALGSYGSYPVASGVPLIRQASGLAVASQVLLGVCVLVHLVSVVPAWNAYALFDELASDRYAVFVVDGTQEGQALLTVSLLQGLAWIATAAVFICWFQRVRRNAGVFQPQWQRHGQGWSIGSWFVPFAAYVLPARIACDVWLSSEPHRQSAGARPQRIPPLVGTWWTTWVAANILSLVSGLLTGNTAPTADDYTLLAGGYGLLTLSQLFAVAAGVLGLLVVRRVDQMQRVSASGFAGGSWSPSGYGGGAFPTEGGRERGYGYPYGSSGYGPGYGAPGAGYGPGSGAGGGQPGYGAPGYGSPGYGQGGYGPGGNG